MENALPGGKRVTQWKARYELVSAAVQSFGLGFLGLVFAFVLSFYF